MKGTVFMHLMKATLSYFWSYMNWVWHVWVRAKSQTVWFEIDLSVQKLFAFQSSIWPKFDKVSRCVSSHCAAVISTWFHLDLKKKKLNVIITKPIAVQGEKKHWQGACAAKNPTVLGTLVNGFEACLCYAMINVNRCVNIQQIISLSLLNIFGCHLSNWINTPIRTENDMQIKKCGFY